MRNASDHVLDSITIITMTSFWARWRLKSPAWRLFTQPFIQAEIKENIKTPRHWPLCGEFAGHRWTPAQSASNAENVSIWWRHYVMISIPSRCAHSNMFYLKKWTRLIDICYFHHILPIFLWFYEEDVSQTFLEVFRMQLEYYGSHLPVRWWWF